MKNVMRRVTLMMLPVFALGVWLAPQNAVPTATRAGRAGGQHGADGARKRRRSVCAQVGPKKGPGRYPRTVPEDPCGPQAGQGGEGAGGPLLLRDACSIHRAGEGAPYTGLKSEPVEPIISGLLTSLLIRGQLISSLKQVTEAVGYRDARSV